jgi:sec-independent protein translocase protein TatA
MAFSENLPHCSRVNLHPSPLALIDFGGPEMVLILVIALILFGGKKMPEFARGLGKAVREFRKAASEVEQEFKKVVDEGEHLAQPPRIITPPARTIVPPPDVQEHGPKEG